MTRTQYRIVWTREGVAPKERKFASRAQCERVERLLTGPEPWKEINPKATPNSFVCCDGRECGCGGQTWKQHCDERRAGLPAITSLVIEKRVVTTTKWESAK